jgi:iron complex transport system ATP-binding protein
MIKVQGVFLQKSKIKILSNINISLTPGKMTIIIGPNGAGKSTLLQVMAGISPPSKGTVNLTLNDRDYQLYSGFHHNEIYRYLSWYGDHTPMMFPYSVEEIVMMGRFPYHQGWPRDEDHLCVLNALDELDIKPLRKRSASSLSSGEFQKMMLARTFTLNPQMILLDEPASHLDPGAFLRLVTLLKAKCSRGTTVGLVLHDLSMAVRLADELIIMNRGEVIAHIKDLADLADPAAMESQGNRCAHKQIEITNYIENIFQIKVYWSKQNGRPMMWICE